MMLEILVSYVSGSSGAGVPAKQGTRLLAGATSWHTSQLTYSFVDTTYISIGIHHSTNHC
jgi:hypothetical protein